MLRLLVLRHGKSDWGAPFSVDLERPLAERGRRAARRMGRFLTASGRAPDSVITSPALRARRTVELAAQAGKWSCPIRVSESLYGGSAQQVLEQVRREPAVVTSVLIAGHQPTWSALISGLIGGGQLRFPTAALACIRFDHGEWSRVDFGDGELSWLVTPRLLDQGGEETS